MSDVDRQVSVDLEKAREMDESLPREKLQEIALGQLVTRLGLTEAEQEDTEIGLMEATFRTVAKMERMEHRLTEIEDQIDKIDRAADTALTLAEQQADTGSSPTKKRVALLKTRNELLRATAVDRSQSSGASVTVSDVQDMARPEVKVYPQTVYDAWDELAADWEAFRRAENADGVAVCRVEPDDLDPALVKAVESSLGRDDLVKRLLSRPERGVGG